jgi:hypothetical protein
MSGFKIDWYIKLLENSSGPMRYEEDESLETFRPDGWGIGSRPRHFPVGGWGGPYVSEKTCHLCGSPNLIVIGRTCDVCLRRLRNQVCTRKELVDF